LNSINDKTIPSAEISIGKGGKIIHQKSFGISSTQTGINNIKEEKINSKSLAAPIALTTAVMILVDENKLFINDPVYKYLNGFELNGKEKITVKNLLLHNSGIGKELDSLNSNWSREELKNALINLNPKSKIGDRVVFSKLNLLLLQFIVESISGKLLDQFIKSKLFDPIGMDNTTFNYNITNDEFSFSNSPSSYINYQSSTDVINRIMNGVTGFGDFNSNAADLAIFSQMMLQNGYYAGKQYISAEIVKVFTSAQLPHSYSALGWQTAISETGIFKGLPLNSYGHNSPSGSSLWIDPDNKIFIVLLIDSGDRKIIPFIPEIQKKIYKTIFNN